MTKYPTNEFRYGSQNWRVFDALKSRPLCNFEILNGCGGPAILKYSGRISEVRRFVRRYGWNVDKTLVGKGIWEYALRPMEGVRGKFLRGWHSGEGWKKPMSVVRTLAGME